MKNALIPTKSKWVNAPLQYVCSCRVRLDDNQRSTLKSAYEAARRAKIPAKPDSVLPGASIAVETSWSVNTELAMPDMLVRDLLNSRESLHLPAVLQLQTILGVEVVTPADVLKAMEGYVDYVFEVAANGKQ
jgi:hypothetical protein